MVEPRAQRAVGTLHPAGLRAIVALSCVAVAPVPAVPLTAQSPQLRLVHTIPNADAPMFFANVGDVGVTTGGVVIVTDLVNHVAYRFSPDGNFRDSIGRQGRGPGEFQMPSLILGLPDGGFAITDLLQARIAIWDSAARLVATHPIPGPTLGGWWTREGLVIRFREFRFPRANVVYAVLDTRTGRMERRLTLPDTLDARAAATGAGTCAFCANTVTQGGRIVVAAPDRTYVLTELHRDGSATEFARRALAGPQRSDAEIEALRAEMRRTGSNPPEPEFFRRLPAVRSLAADDRGRIWALRWAPGHSASTMDVFAADGTLLGSVALDIHVLSVRIQDTALFATTEDADGVPMVQIYRIIG